MSPPLTQLRSALAGRYDIERELGRGGMATVYLAEDVRHRRKVAIKVLHPDLSAVLGPERFLKEIELTASLQHPHILPLFDSGSADGQLYYVMPFVEGETLRARLERERQLPVNDAVQLAREVADALQYAHQHSVIHRDVKPENILLQGGHALVADFGIALAVQEAGGQRLTQTGLSLGTPQYMAPEQATGEKTVDARADIYALGAATHEMLAGTPPFTAPTMQAVVAKLLTEDPPPLAAQRRSIPPHVEAAVMTALEKLPADRFPDARSFAGGGTPERLVAGHWLNTITSIGPDGTLFGVAAARAPGSDWDLISLHPGDTLRNVLVTRYAEAWPSLSPNGEWLAYASNESGRSEVYVRRVDGAGGRLQLSLDGGSEPVWNPNGRELFYRRLMASGSELVVAELALSPEARVTARHTLFDATGYDVAVPHANYDVSPDGQHVVMVRGSKARGLVYLQNVPELARASAGRQ